MIALPNPDTPVLARDGRSLNVRWFTALQNALKKLAERLTHSAELFDDENTSGTANAWDLMRCDPASDEINITLPANAPDGALVCVANTTGSAVNPINVLPSSGDTVRGTSLDTVGTTAALYSYGATQRDWVRIT